MEFENDTLLTLDVFLSKILEKFERFWNIICLAKVFQTSFCKSTHILQYFDDFNRFLFSFPYVKFKWRKFFFFWYVSTHNLSMFYSHFHCSLKSICKLARNIGNLPWRSKRRPKVVLGNKKTTSWGSKHPMIKVWKKF